MYSGTATILYSHFTSNSAHDAGGVVYVDQGALAVLAWCSFIGNMAESAGGASVVHVEPDGKALFYFTVTFASNQGNLMVVKGRGTLLLDGGLLPERPDTGGAGADSAYFGILEFGATLLHTAVPADSPSHQHPSRHPPALPGTGLLCAR